MVSQIEESSLLNLNQKKTYQKYGYARVSGEKSKENDSLLSEQKKRLLAKGIPEENIRVEEVSLCKPMFERPVMKKLISEELQSNDLLYVTKIDRCSKNISEFLKLQEILNQKGISFIALELPYSSPTDEMGDVDVVAMSRLITRTLAAISATETKMRRRRQHLGFEAAKKAGRYPGRKTVIDDKLIAQVKELKENQNLPVTEIARRTGYGRNTIYKVLKQELGYIPYNRLMKPSKNSDSQ